MPHHAPSTLPQPKQLSPLGRWLAAAQLAKETLTIVLLGVPLLLDLPLLAVAALPGLVLYLFRWVLVLGRLPRRVAAAAARMSGRIASSVTSPTRPTPQPSRESAIPAPMTTRVMRRLTAAPAGSGNSLFRPLRRSARPHSPDWTAAHILPRSSPQPATESR